MQILKSTFPYIVQFSLEDMNYLHLACHYYKDWLKHSDKVEKSKRRERLRHLNHLIALIDLMM